MNIMRILLTISFQQCESGTTPPSLSTNAYVSDDIKVKGLHRALTAAIVDHIWDAHGKAE